MHNYYFNSRYIGIIQQNIQSISTIMARKDDHYHEIKKDMTGTNLIVFSTAVIIIIIDIYTY